MLLVIDKVNVTTLVVYITYLKQIRGLSGLTYRQAAMMSTP